VAGVVDTSGNLPLVLLTPAATLLLVSITPVVLVAKFTTGVVDTGAVVHLGLQISPWIVEKNFIWPWCYFQELREDDSWKKSEAKKISWYCPFKVSKCNYGIYVCIKYEVILV
jgi:hypothetical protein